MTNVKIGDQRSSMYNYSGCISNDAINRVVTITAAIVLHRKSLIANFNIRHNIF